MESASFNWKNLAPVTKWFVTQAFLVYFQNFLVQLQGTILVNQGFDLGLAGVENLVLFGMLHALICLVTNLGTVYTYIFPTLGL